MNRLRIAVLGSSLALGATFGAVWVQTPQAHSEPLRNEPAGITCEYRSAAHIREHGGLTEDNAYHLAHGDLPTCGQPEDKEQPASRDNPDRWRRDEPGFHCTWRGCG